MSETDYDQSSFRWPSLEKWILGFLILLKLWLISDLDIVASQYIHDMLWVMRSAQIAYWGDAPYSSMAYIKEPLMPLFLAGCKEIGIPARIGIELLLIFAALVFVQAGPFRRGNGWMKAGRCLLFASIIFYPVTVGIFCQVTADPLYISLMVLWMALSLNLCWSMKETGSIRWVGGCALAMVSGLMAITRPEEVFVLISLFCCGGALVAIGVARGASGFRVLRCGLGMGGVILGMGLITGVVKTINYERIGFWGISEQTESNYCRAIKALRSVRSETPDRFVWIDNQTLKKVAAVSPAVKIVEPYLTGRLMIWNTCVPDNNLTKTAAISASVFPWALRDAVDLSGNATSAPSSALFYGRMADEIIEAQHKGLLPRQSTLGYGLSLDKRETCRLGWKSMRYFFKESIAPSPFVWTDDQPGVSPETIKLFDQVGNRRMYSRTVFNSRLEILRDIKGWIANTSTFSRLALISSPGVVSAVLQERTDVGAHLGVSGTNQCWGFRIRVGTASRKANLEFRDERNVEYVIDLNELKSKKPNSGFTVEGSDGTRALCWIDLNNPGEYEWREYYEGQRKNHRRIWAGLEKAWPWLIGLAGVGLILGLFRATSSARRWVGLTLLMGVMVILLRLGMLLIMDVFWFDSQQLRYTCPVTILVLPILLWGSLVLASLRVPNDTSEVDLTRQNR